MHLPKIFNADTITYDGDVIYPRIYTSLYPNMEFIEDSRPDYFILREDLDRIITEVYKTEGRILYKSYISGRCLEIRLIDKYKTMFCITHIIGEEMADRNYRLSSKDISYAEEMNEVGSLQESLDSTTAEKYNEREIAPLVTEDELVHSMLHSVYYPLGAIVEAAEFLELYNGLKFDKNLRKEKYDNVIYTLGQNSGGLTLHKHFLDTAKYKIDIISSNYNDNFAPVYDNILSFLKSDQSGLVLFTGEPGTGKSSLLMHLTTACKELNTRFVFIPAAFAAVLSDPSFLPFAVTTLNNSVLILEDAEDVLKDRAANGTGAVSNILNVTDGILGKIVKVKLIATINKPQIIDSAILRKGRLKVQYTFEKLVPDKANALLTKLGSSRTTKVPMTLAEIYNESTAIVPTILPEKTVGFSTK